MPEKKTISAERFSSVWTAVVSHAPPSEVFAELIARYTEPHRAYHTTQHLEECLVQFDLAASVAAGDRPHPRHDHDDHAQRRPSFA